MKTTVLLVIILVTTASVDSRLTDTCPVGWYRIDGQCLRRFSSRFKRSSCIAAGHKTAELDGFEEMCVHKRIKRNATWLDFLGNALNVQLKSLQSTTVTSTTVTEATTTTKPTEGKGADAAGFGNPGFLNG